MGQNKRHYLGSAKNFFGLKGLEASSFKMSLLSQQSQPSQKFQPQTLGAILTIAIIAGIALVVGAGTTALVTIKPWKNQSNIDLKESKELKALLENADPVVAQKIREDIKSQLVDAYTTGNRQGVF